MKTPIARILSAVLLAPLFAIAEDAKPTITVQQEVELYQAILSLDRGGVKLIDSKATAVPFTFSAATRYALAVDADLVKKPFDEYSKAADAKRGEIAPKASTNGSAEAALTNAQQATLESELAPVAAARDPLPEFKKIALPDLNLDTNPITTDALMKLRVIIQP